MSEVPDTLTQGFLRNLKIETLFAVEQRLEEDISTSSDPDEVVCARDDLRRVRSFIVLREQESGLR